MDCVTLPSARGPPHGQTNLKTRVSSPSYRTNSSSPVEQNLLTHRYRFPTENRLSKRSQKATSRPPSSDGKSWRPAPAKCQVGCSSPHQGPVRRRLSDLVFLDWSYSNLPRSQRS